MKQMFFWNSRFFYDPTDGSNLISGSSAFSKSSLNICKFSVHVLLKPGLENFEHYFANACNENNCAVVWAFFGITFLWDWNENWYFPVLWLLIMQYFHFHVSQFQLLSHVRLFMTPWAAAHQASLSITNSCSLLKLTSIESVMPSNHLILCCSHLLLPSILPSIRVFSNESVLCIRWPKYWSFSISCSNEYSGLLSFKKSFLCNVC